jgi:SAM-dependent methyltransferase
MNPQPHSPRYLKPYQDAAARHGAGFGSLLWASPRTQTIRFEALQTAAGDLNGLHLLDVGCGRADFLSFLLRRGVVPGKYVGLEAVAELAEAAEKQRVGGTILRGDFVADPACMQVGADMVVFSGSLNTLDESQFYQSVDAAYAAAGLLLVFNFLCSARLSGSPHLTWHEPARVLEFAKRRCDHVRIWEQYLIGDATITMRKARC